MTPDKYTISERFIDVSDEHELYVHDYGNEAAKLPIVYLHGGPGGGCNDGNKQLIVNPKKQRAIFFDQRGAGKSLPRGSLKHNTTADLVEDIETIAKIYKLQQFVIAGGSWGSCLALAYALKYPKKVKALVLRGIFTGSQAEIDWIDKGEFRHFFPDVWQQFLERTPKKWHKNPTAYHATRILGDDLEAATLSAYAYSELEGSLLKLDDRHTPEDLMEFDLNCARIEIHYLQNNCFMPDRFILDNAHKLVMPIMLVQGRYDAVCPPTTAYELNKRLPNGNLVWTVGGHSGGERGTYDVMRSVLLQITS